MHRLNSSSAIFFPASPGGCGTQATVFWNRPARIQSVDEPGLCTEKSAVEFVRPSWKSDCETEYQVLSTDCSSTLNQMPLQVYRLRRLLAATAVLLTAIVAGMYFYAGSKATDVLKSIPNKMGIDIKQTASGFQISKSDGKRTLFTVQASSVKQFKLNGNAELHNVNIILYGRDSSRFDQIYGENFAYNQKTGDVTATGEVQIDLVANSAGLASPDQATP